MTTVLSMASLTTMPRRSLRPGTFSGAGRSALALLRAAETFFVGFTTGAAAFLTAVFFAAIVFFGAAFFAAAFLAAGLRAADCLGAGLPLSVFFVVAIRLHHRLPCARVPAR